jgi:hypothetical protein
MHHAPECLVRAQYSFALGLISSTRGSSIASFLVAALTLPNHAMLASSVRSSLPSSDLTTPTLLKKDEATSVIPLNTTLPTLRDRSLHWLITGYLVINKPDIVKQVRHSRCPLFLADIDTFFQCKAGAASSLSFESLTSRERHCYDNKSGIVMSVAFYEGSTATTSFSKTPISGRVGGECMLALTKMPQPEGTTKHDTQTHV